MPEASADSEVAVAAGLAASEAVGASAAGVASIAAASVEVILAAVVLVVTTDSDVPTPAISGETANAHRAVFVVATPTVGTAGAMAPAIGVETRDAGTAAR